MSELVLTHVTKGKHVRTPAKGTGLQIEVFKKGDPILPTPEEMAAFPDRFEPREGFPSMKGAVRKEYNIDMSRLEALKKKLSKMITEDEFEEEALKEAEQMLARRPEQQHTIDALADEIEKWILEVEEEEETAVPEETQEQKDAKAKQARK